MTSPRNSGTSRRAQGGRGTTQRAPQRKGRTSAPKAGPPTSKPTSSPKTGPTRAQSPRPAHAKNARDLAKETRHFRRSRKTDKYAEEAGVIPSAITRPTIFYDLWGVGFVVVGLLSGLGLYAGKAGPLGNQLAKLLGELFGLGKYGVPIYMLLIGGYLFFAGFRSTRAPVLYKQGPQWPGQSIVGQASSELADPEIEFNSIETTVGSDVRETDLLAKAISRNWPSSAVFAGGLGAILVCISSFVDIAQGSPGWTIDLSKLSNQGGVVGVALGSSLHDVSGTAGAAVLLVAISLGSFMVATKVSLSDLFAMFRKSFTYLARSLNHKSYFSNLAKDLVALESPDITDNRDYFTTGSSSDLDTGIETDAAAYNQNGASQPQDIFPDNSLPESQDVFLDERLSEPLDASLDEPLDYESLDGYSGDDCDAQGVLGSYGDFLPTTSMDNSHRQEDLVNPIVEQLDLGLAPQGKVWKLPSLRLLERNPLQKTDESQASTGARVLQEALASHGVDTRVTNYTVGPTVTRYEVEIGPGVKVAQVTNLSKDIAYAMASPDVRILAPIPGRSAIGVEVPNQHRQLVSLGDILSSSQALEARHPLQVGLGRDISGKPIMANIAEMPHVLIAGATGAGKSSCINSLVTSLLVRSTPDDVRLILVDPKRVELGQYNGLPHLLTQVVVDPRKAANALSWAVKEMERRYDLLAEVGVRDITGYNELVKSQQDQLATLSTAELAPEASLELEDSGLDVGWESSNLENAGQVSDFEGNEQDNNQLDIVEQYSGENLEDEPEEMAAMSSADEDIVDSMPRYESLPFIVIVVDELNDLMMVAARDVEESICRIAQMARAVGIHLVIATQRPSVDVITGVIKANIPSRLAFSVSSLADSRVILDQPGAERLVGKGDMLMLTASSSIPTRVQGPWVSEHEVRKIVGHWKRQGGTNYVDGVEGDGSKGSSSSDDEFGDDEMLMPALELVVRSQIGSTSMLQRKLRVGFARAGRLMDLLERRGIVGPSEGSKARAVLMTPDELNEMLENSGN